MYVYMDTRGAVPATYIYAPDKKEKKKKGRAACVTPFCMPETMIQSGDAHARMQANKMGGGWGGGRFIETGSK